MSHGRERAFNRVGRPEVFPVLGREAVEGKQRIAVLRETGRRLLVFEPIAFDKGFERAMRGSW